MQNIQYNLKFLLIHKKTAVKPKLRNVFPVKTLFLASLLRKSDFTNKCVKNMFLYTFYGIRILLYTQ